MHGIVMTELKNYVVSKFAAETWEALLRKAKLWPRLYLPVAEYPDLEIQTLVGTASEMTGLKPAAIMEDFGEFITAGLLRMYAPLVKDHWRTLDLIEHTETTIHTAIRLRDKRMKPPELQCIRISPEEVKVMYRSKRRMSAVARGIIKGVAKHYDETVTIAEHAYENQEGPVSELTVRLVGVEPRSEQPLPEPELVGAAVAAPAPAEPAVRKSRPEPEPVARRPRKLSFLDRLFGRK